MSKGLFFPGVVLTNNRNLLEEENARQQLDIQREELLLQKERLAMERSENRKKNAPKYKDFGQSNVGLFNTASRNNIDSYIQSVSNDPENFELKANLENKVSNENALFVKMHTDYEAKMAIVAAGGDTLDKANYVKGDDGVYEFERRYNSLAEQVNSGSLNADSAFKSYFDNTDNSLYLIRERTSLGQGIVDSYEGPKDSYLQDTEDGEREIRGYNSEAKKAIYLAYKNELKFNKDGVFETPDGEKAYFNSSTDGELNMIKFFKEEEGKLTVDENSPILTQLDPKSGDFDQELSNRYLNYLAKVETDAFMVDKVVNKTKGSGDDKFENAVAQNDWDIMSSDQEVSDISYGTHGKMLSKYTFTQNTGGEHDITAPMLNNMQVSSRPTNESGTVLDTETAKRYILKQLSEGDGKIKRKLSQVAISEDHTNMYGIYTITVGNEATGGKGDMNIEISVPIDNLRGLKFGGTIPNWIASMEKNDAGKYSTGGSSTTPKGVGSKYN